MTKPLANSVFGHKSLIIMVCQHTESHAKSQAILQFNIKYSKRLINQCRMSSQQTKEFQTNIITSERPKSTATFLFKSLFFHLNGREIIYTPPDMDIDQFGTIPHHG